MRHPSKTSFQARFSSGHKPFNRDCVARFAHGAGLSLASGEKARGNLEKAAAEYRKRLAGLTQRLPHLTLGWPLADADAPAIEALRLAQSHLAQATAGADRREYELTQFDQERASLQRAVTAMADWAARGDRWAMLSDAEQAEITPLLARWTEYYALGYLHLAATSQVHRIMQDAADGSLHAMAVAPDSVFALLPLAVQTASNGPYRQPICGLRHQMFGTAQNIRSAAEDYSDHRLLLQINTDDLQGFSWGDRGGLQAWIRTADLLAGDWSAVEFNFESH